LLLAELVGQGGVSLRQSRQVQLRLQLRSADRQRLVQRQHRARRHQLPLLISAGTQIGTTTRPRGTSPGLSFAGGPACVANGSRSTAAGSLHALTVVAANAGTRAANASSQA